MYGFDFNTPTDTDKAAMLANLCDLVIGLTEKNIKFTVRPLFDGVQVRTADWDVVCHFGSYGHQGGLFEGLGVIFGDENDEVEGFLTAQDILDRL